MSVISTDDKFYGKKVSEIGKSNKFYTRWLGKACVRWQHMKGLEAYETPVARDL